MPCLVQDGCAVGQGSARRCSRPGAAETRSPDRARTSRSSRNPFHGRASRQRAGLLRFGDSYDKAAIKMGQPVRTRELIKLNGREQDTNSVRFASLACYPGKSATRRWSIGAKASSKPITARSRSCAVCGLPYRELHDRLVAFAVAGRNIEIFAIDSFSINKKPIYDRKNFIELSQKIIEYDRIIIILECNKILHWLRNIKNLFFRNLKSNIIFFGKNSPNLKKKSPLIVRGF